MDADEVRKIARDEASNVGCGLALITVFLLFVIFAAWLDNNSIKALEQRVDALEQKK